MDILRVKEKLSKIMNPPSYHPPVRSSPFTPLSPRAESPRQSKRWLLGKAPDC